MPNSARLVAALFLGALAFVLSDMVKPLFDEGFNFGYFNYVNVFIGLFVGWSTVGRRAGRGITAAINNGVTGIVSLVFLALFVQSVNEMLRLALRHRYDNMFEAIIDIFQIGLDYFVLMATVPILGVAIAGGVVAGLVTEVVWFRWR